MKESELISLLLKNLIGAVYLLEEKNVSEQILKPYKEAIFMGREYHLEELARIDEEIFSK